MLESPVEWMNFPLYYAMEARPPRDLREHTISLRPSPATARSMLGLQNEREAAFCDKVLLDPGSSRRALFDELEVQRCARRAARVDPRRLASLSAEEVVERLIRRRSPTRM
jgi:hypothetical protein